jgi:hypothetical protein
MVHAGEGAAFIRGIALYALAPSLAGMGNKALFVLAFGVILSMYGGGFSTIPLADIFGTQFVGADAKAMLAWAVVGIPLLWGVWVTLKATFALFG